jgi:hypothetical protein
MSWAEIAGVLFKKSLLGFKDSRGQGFKGKNQKENKTLESLDPHLVLYALIKRLDPKISLLDKGIADVRS